LAGRRRRRLVLGDRQWPQALVQREVDRRLDGEAVEATGLRLVPHLRLVDGPAALRVVGGVLAGGVALDRVPRGARRVLLAHELERERQLALHGGRAAGDAPGEAEPLHLARGE